MFVDGPVSVEVPATSANLGPGFDCLGVALGLRDTLTASIAETTSVVIEGEGAGALATDERHLVVRAMRTAWEHLGLEAPGVALECNNRIPQSRGLGSSSAAIVGGLALARALVVDGAALLPDQMLVALANQIEGHPDNVAPAVMGGFVVCGQEGGQVWAMQSALDARIGAVVFIPPTPLSTEVARGLLPRHVLHADAAANAGRAALLVAALANRPEMLLRATEDFLHQSYRAPAMQESAALIAELRATGVPAVVSGAGPTVLAFTGPGLPDAASALAHRPAGWTAREIELGVSGVQQTAPGVLPS